ncbi:hypothetical protein Scep_024449 [Stephania cephalantha]|uniref:Uncharacterized protein n=1 Tax=Stephania cephalantha TaxID=152367 RepID=A0AAP0F5J3_9MAGN
MSLKKQPLEVIKSEDHQSPKKWCISLMEDKFNSFISQGDHPLVHKVFGAGSLFSPFLFRKYFDPSDAFPLWEFGSDILSSSSSVQNGGRSAVEWFETDKEYGLKAELPVFAPRDLRCLPQQLCLYQGLYGDGSYTVGDGSYTVGGASTKP